MRPIKYRQRIMINGKEIVNYWGMFPNEAESHWIGPMTTINKATGKPWISEQFTGLTDHNGREVYENDRITILYTKINHSGVVVWHEAGWHFRRDDLGQWHFRRDDLGQLKPLSKCFEFCLGVEVVGNIHENPETK